MSRNNLDQYITGYYGEDSVGEDLDTEQAQVILDEANSGWTALHDAALETCCGVIVEWDQEKCPKCWSNNPLVASAYI